MRFLGALLTIVLLPLALSAQGTATLTLLEGSLKVIRGANAMQGVEGMQLRQGDILESSDGGFAQIEFASGTIVALGPSSKVFLFRAGTPRGAATAAKEPEANLILLNGWLKGESNAAAVSYRYTALALGAESRNGAIVLHAEGSGCDVNVESGSWTIGEISLDGSWRDTKSAKAGQFFSRREGKGVSTSSHPSSAFVSAMPRAFMDSLPTRLAHFHDKKPAESKSEHLISYADLQPWLTLPAAWRRGFVERFSLCLKDPEFRKQIEAHLAQYPEWDPLLHPEKYKQDAKPAAKRSDSPPKW